MLRLIRVQFPGALQHVLSRGDQRQDIFFDDVDPTPDYENVLTD